MESFCGQHVYRGPRDSRREAQIKLPSWTFRCKPGAATDQGAYYPCTAGFTRGQSVVDHDTSAKRHMCARTGKNNAHKSNHSPRINKRTWVQHLTPSKRRVAQLKVTKATDSLKSQLHNRVARS